MPSDAVSSTKIMNRLLWAMAAQSHAFVAYEQLHHALTEDDCEESEVITNLLASLERYIQGQRIMHLTDYWGGLDKGTPAQAEQVTVPPARMAQVMGILGFYGIPRTALFLYAHAYLLSALKIRPSILVEMDKFIDELDPR